MTQKNIDIMNLIIKTLEEGKTIAQTIRLIFKNPSVAIPFSNNMLDTSVTELEISVRTHNALLRNHIYTISDVIEFNKRNGITKAKGLGKGSAIDLFESILNWCWTQMTNDERMNFLIDTIERNNDKII